MILETLSRPAFRVVRYYARFNDRDAICGWDGRFVDCARTVRHAFLIAGRLGRWDDGEAYTEVLDAEGRKVVHPLLRIEWALEAAGFRANVDDLPF